MAPPTEVNGAEDDDRPVRSGTPESSLSQHLEAQPETLLGGRYLVTATLGRGVFATVYRCIDTQPAAMPEVAVDMELNSTSSVAVKVLRRAKDAEAIFRSELSVLTAISHSQSNATHNLVRLLDSFQHDLHFCLVVENLQCNLRYVKS